MTGRALALAMVPVALLLAATAAGGLVGVAVAAVVVLMLACVVDHQLAPGAGQWQVRREHEAALSIGVGNRLDLIVASQSRHPTTALVRDEIAPELRPDPAVFRARIAGWGSFRCRTTLTPSRRGRYPLGRVVLRAAGPLGLWTRQVRLACPGELRVYPDLTLVRSWDTSSRRGDPLLPGLRRARRADPGLEFRGVREHADGDDLRLVNWRASARLGRLMTTEHQPERSQTVWVLVDCGRVMQGGIDGLQKLDHACNAALLFIHVALAGGDRVGVLAFADRVGAVLPPRPGHAQFRRALDALYALQPASVESDPASALARWRRLQGRRALCVLFTDLADASGAERLAPAVAGIQPRHVALVVTQRDPALGRAAWAPPTDLAAVQLRAAALAAIADRTAALETLRRLGILTLDSTQPALAPAVVNRYLELKARSRL